jgi:hypothetical protein
MEATRTDSFMTAREDAKSGRSSGMPLLAMLKVAQKDIAVRTTAQVPDRPFLVMGPAAPRPGNAGFRKASDGTVKEIPAADLTVDDIFVLRPGARGREGAESRDPRGLH